MLPAPRHHLPCRLDVPDVLVPKARYAVEQLLVGLGLAPRWVDAVPPDGLHYAAEPHAAAGLPLALAPDAATVLAGPQRLPERMAWWSWGDEAWPLPFGTPEAPDLVASAFFWLSGWQEAAVPERDRHGRFPFAASLQAHLGTATRPAVDAYRAALAERLAAAGLPVAPRRWAGRAWALVPTHDVDYLRKWRPGMIRREAVHYLLRNHRGEPLPQRAARFGHFLRDWLRPGDVYREALERMPRETAARGGHGTYLFKTGAHGPHDVPYAPDGRYLRRQVAALVRDGFEVGLHPSYHAHDHAGRLAEERARVERLAGAPPASVRQHYLRWTAPATPRLHARAGFAIDSTLGFAEHEGFRHATCHPFRLYDLAADRPLDLWEMPLALMEAALFNRRGLDAGAARAATAALAATVRRFGGALVGLWHNTLWDELDHPGWGEHFTDTLDLAAEQDALIDGLAGALSTWA